jgi:hypothetical protein
LVAVFGATTMVATQAASAQGVTVTQATYGVDAYPVQADHGTGQIVGFATYVGTCTLWTSTSTGTELRRVCRAQHTAGLEIFYPVHNYIPGIPRISDNTLTVIVPARHNHPSEFLYFEWPVRQYGLTVRPARGVERAGSPTSFVG